MLGVSPNSTCILCIIGVEDKIDVFVYNILIGILYS